MKKIRVLLADDHTIVRDGIRALLEDEPDMVVVGEAEDGRAAVKMACTQRPDVVLMDIAMPLLNGLEATRQIKREQPAINVLILTMHENEEYIRQVLAAGAMGYVLKDAAARDLLGALRAVAAGEAVLSPAVTRLVLEDYLRWADLQPQDAAGEPGCLTLREREVLQLVAEGHTNKEIAEILCISIKTVQSHRSNLMQKLDLHDRGELIKYAIQKKIIEI
ncbi:MAG TPA: response regulator transcription factor [Candidatus Sulfomarinibacteraceae bacterium]|nr:response regulator transcription factor [Candidatus Sulfomarinibacteraceae bacterium]